uniref:Uncharacterized protein n=1 Tax=Arundo donax TaxID=35708 RepID=A0A0A9D8U5_ARUDO
MTIKAIKEALYIQENMRICITVGYWIGGNNGSGRSSGKKGCSSGLLYLPTCAWSLSVSLTIYSAKEPSKPSIWKSIVIICISIVTKLGSLQEAEYDAVFLSNQRVSNAVQRQYFTLIYPLFPSKSARLKKKIDQFFSVSQNWLPRKESTKQDNQIFLQKVPRLISLILQFHPLFKIPLVFLESFNEIQ